MRAGCLLDIPGVVSKKGAHRTGEETASVGSQIFHWHLQERNQTCLSHLEVPGDRVSMCMG